MILILSPDSITLAKAYSTGDFGSAASLTPIEFLQVLTDTVKRVIYPSGEIKAIRFLTLLHDFPENWIRSADMNQLVPLMYSRQSCKCYVNPLSSHRPFDSSAQVGGFAMAMVKAFKENRKLNLGLYYCPKFDQYEADQLRNWWENHRTG